MDVLSLWNVVQSHDGFAFPYAKKIERQKDMIMCSRSRVWERETRRKRESKVIGKRNTKRGGKITKLKHRDTHIPDTRTRTHTHTHAEEWRQRTIGGGRGDERRCGKERRSYKTERNWETSIILDESDAYIYARTYESRNEKIQTNRESHTKKHLKVQLYHNNK